MSFENLDNQVKQSAPLIERLEDCMSRIGKMCKEGRPPKMTIPCNWNDDDIFIVATIREAVEHLRAADTASAPSTEVDPSLDIIHANVAGSQPRY